MIPCDQCQIVHPGVVQLHVRAQVARGEILRGWSFCGDACAAAWWAEATEDDFVHVVIVPDDATGASLIHAPDDTRTDGEVTLRLERYTNDGNSIRGERTHVATFQHAAQLNVWWREPE